MPRTPKGGPTQHVANILGRMKSGERNRMLEDIAARDAQTAQTVRALMFTFDDLIRIDARGIQELLRNIDMDQLACALKGASPEIQKLFYVNMSVIIITLVFVKSGLVVEWQAWILQTFFESCY